MAVGSVETNNRDFVFCSSLGVDLMSYLQLSRAGKQSSGVREGGQESVSPRSAPEQSSGVGSAGSFSQRAGTHSPARLLGPRRSPRATST